MKSPCIKATKSRQKGEMLMEALVAMGLVGVLASGPAYVMGRVTVMSTFTNAQVQAISQMRDLLHTRGGALCATDAAVPQILLGGERTDVTVSCTDIQEVAVNSVFVSSNAAVGKLVSLTVTDAQRFGGTGVLAVSE